MMKELETILFAHAGRYPQMEPTDAVKLIYQNEFGGGHLIRDEDAALRYLRQEYETVVKDSSGPLWEDIGNGLVRVNLAAVSEGDLDRLGKAFLASAAGHQGSMAHFREKLEGLRTLARKGIFQFSVEELDAYLKKYEQAGYPMVSHSPQYRQAYRPAYRVALRSYMESF